MIPAPPALNQLLENDAMLIDHEPEPIPVHPDPPEPPPLPAKRLRKLPAKLRDLLPTDTVGIRQFQESDNRYQELDMDSVFDGTLPAQPEAPPRSPSPLQPEPYITKPDEFGLYRVYRVLPQCSPDDQFDVSTVADAPTFIREEKKRNPTAGFGVRGGSVLEENKQTWYSPFLNASTFRLMDWYYQSTSLSLASLDNLVQNVILAPDFEQSDFDGFQASREAQRIDDRALGRKGMEDMTLPFRCSDVWTEAEVSIPLPFPGQRYHSEQEAPHITLNVAHRKLTEVVRSAYKDPSATEFHWKGFTQMWKPSPDEPAQRIYGEAYMSDRYAELEDSIVPEPGCTLEYTVAPIMIYSDTTKLTNFGFANLWPAYMWLVCQLKYTLICPTSFSMHHFAYFPSVSDHNSICGCLTCSVVT